MPCFTYDGKSCYYEEHGKGTPLLFLHGNTASSIMFRDLVESFASDYRVVLIDFLGHGKSDRVERFAEDLWFDEALQTIALAEQAGYRTIDLIGSSGGALVAINVALERPDLVRRVIADSFEGDVPLSEFVQNIREDRQASKWDAGGKAFYAAMHGDDWEGVVDNDTRAIQEHARKIGKFFHAPLNTLQAEILLTGSNEDEFVQLVRPDFYARTYSNLLGRIGHGKMYLFDQGGHPAILSSKDSFVRLAKGFLAG